MFLECMLFIYVWMDAHLWTADFLFRATLLEFVWIILMLKIVIVENVLKLLECFESLLLNH